MGQLKSGLLLIAMLLLALPLQAQKLSDAFIGIKEKTLRKEFEHLAMMPVIASSAAALPEATRQFISDEVLEILIDEDFKILPPQETKAIAQELAKLYPVPAPAQIQAAIDEHTLRELFFRHPVDGLVSVQILVVAAPFANDKAKWFGTTQKIEHRGDGLFGSIMGSDYGGHIAASSIRVSISDRAGKTLYNWSGGVEVMMQRNGDKLEPLPEDSLWQDEKRVKKALKYALKPF